MLVFVLMTGCTTGPERSQEPAAQPADEGNDVVATVLGMPIRSSDLEENSLSALILDPLFEKYRKDRGIVATEAEIESFLESTLRSAESRDDSVAVEFGIPPIPEFLRKAAEREVAALFVVDWKTSREMHQEFGGKVIFQQSNPLEPVGAYLAFLRQQERKGAFEIRDEGLAGEFWEYFTADHSLVVPPDKVDYSVPWWEQNK